MKNLGKILYLVCILVIIIGVIVWKVSGVNYSLEYSKGKNIEIYFDNSTEKYEIEDIAKEIFGNNVKVLEIERFKDAFSIMVKDITEEQKSELISKINEKYSLELTEDDITIVDIPKVNGFDLINVYIQPTLISLAAIFIYLCIRYSKIGNAKTAIVTILKVIAIMGAYFGIVIVTRLPIVNMYTIPIGLLISIISLIVICYNNENKIEKLNEEKK